MHDVTDSAAAEAIVLYHSPGACSRVTMNALEEIGLAFVDRPLSIVRGDQKRPDYLAVNPKGKVPALLVGKHLLTENVAILNYLASTYPLAALLPDFDDPIAAAHGLADLAWCASTLHPLVRQMLRAANYSATDADTVKHNAMRQFAEISEQIADRLSAGDWWYGDRWSIVDVYLYWVGSVAAYAGFEPSRPDIFAAHTDRVRARPSFGRALERERIAVEQRDVPIPPGAGL